MVLRFFQKEDIPEFLQWFRDTDPAFLVQFSGPKYAYPLDRAQLEDTINSDEYIPFAAIDDETREMIGHCQLTRMDYGKGTASIGRVLIKPGKQGKGNGRRLLRMLMEHATEHYGFRKYSLNVYDFNEAAYNCYRSLGFVETNRKEAYIGAIGKTWTSIQMELEAQSQ